MRRMCCLFAVAQAIKMKTDPNRAADTATSIVQTSTGDETGAAALGMAFMSFSATPDAVWAMDLCTALGVG